MSYDLLISNARIVDGTGAASFVGDLGMKAGKIVALGQLAGGTADRTIDARGRAVAPGFIDPHTHYDAQISWDPLVTPSSWHGVTTVVIGNCGVGVAPSRPESRELQIWDLVNVEAMSKEVLEAGIDWRWGSFPEYMNAIFERGCAINVGFLVPLSPLRTFVMGKAASDRSASAKELDQMTGLLREAMAAGAVGYSSSRFPIHNGFEGKPLASRAAVAGEYQALARVLKEFGRGGIELALTKDAVMIADDEYALLETLLEASGRPVTWITLLDLEGKPQMADRLLERAAPLYERGSLPQTMVRPFLVGMDLANPFIFGAMPCWKAAMNKPKNEQIALYQSKQFRDAFKKQLAAPDVFAFSGDWSQVSLVDSPDPNAAEFFGQSIARIGDATGKSGIDALLDTAIAGGLDTRYSMVVANSDPGRLAEMIRNPQTRLGLGDGGAHVDMLCEAGYPTYLLGHWVRETGVLGLEEAVKMLTSEPADMFGMADRGRIAVGKAADLVIFDPATVGSAERPHMIRDLPAGGKRLVAEATGIDYTLVNGQVAFESGTHTGALTGRIAY